MPSSIKAPQGQLSRRDRFRAYMQTFNPTAPPRDVVEAGLVCDELHQSLYRNLAARADLEPGCQQLLVGGVGSGKTTELILAERWLKSHGHAVPLYIDVSASTNLLRLNPGALLAIFAMDLGWLMVKVPETRSQSKQKKEKLTDTYRKLTEFAFGKKVKRELNPIRDLNFLSGSFSAASQSESNVAIEWIPGKLTPPLPVLDRDIREMFAPIDEILAIFKDAKKDVVVVFDGLDRLLDPTKFWSVVHQDLQLLRKLKVSVIATAPLSVLFGVGVGQSISDHFDRVHHLAVIATDPENALLRSVLEKRRSTELLSGLLTDSICHYSGGVLRDLISLARDAAEEAYVSDRDSITVADVEKVTHQLGTGYLRGLGPEAVNTLFQLESTKSFDVSQPANVELLATRRVLEYSSTDFRVHPALLSVIPRLEPKRA
jgi:hypothetical protein